jgi:XTP/dITP diphosphohydrolase
MENVPDEQRTARFICVIAVANPHTMTCMTSTGMCEGRIAHVDDPEGTEGFGYDAIFIPTGYDVPFSRIPKEVKRHLSHRGDAARKLIPVLRRLASEQG